jgi:hypothetical protein
MDNGAGDPKPAEPTEQPWEKPLKALEAKLDGALESLKQEPAKSKEPDLPPKKVEDVQPPKKDVEPSKEPKKDEPPPKQPRSLGRRILFG